MAVRVRDPEKMREYARRHYERNREAMISRAAQAKEASRNAVRAYILDHLRLNPCVDCGEPDPVVLEFDHRGDKDFAIGDAVRRALSLKRVVAEIAKCDVRCANCHRRKTYGERGSFWKD